MLVSLFLSLLLSSFLSVPPQGSANIARTGEQKLFFIDVSQSVEHDHPASFDFLRKDCENVTNFFFKKGVGAVMTLRELFDFVTDVAITSENFEEYLDKMMERCAQRPAPTAKEMVAAEVFKTAFIPQKLADIDHVERDLDRAMALATAQRSTPRQTATNAAYDDLLGNTAEDDNEFLYRKVIGVEPEKNVGRSEPELLAKPKKLRPPRGPKRVTVEFEEAGKLGVSFDREDADLKVVGVSETGLAAAEGSIKPGMRLHAVESDALGGPQCVSGMAYADALGMVAKAGRPMALTFLCEELESEEEEEEDSDGSKDNESEEEEEEERVWVDRTRDPVAEKAAKKLNKKQVKEANRLRRETKTPKKVKKRKKIVAKRH